MSDKRILNIISRIRNSHPEMVNIYSSGGCLNFYLILKAIFPEAVAYDNRDHIITKIGESFYDITGAVSGDKYLPLRTDDRRGIKQMFKAEYKM